MFKEIRACELKGLGEYMGNAAILRAASGGEMTDEQWEETLQVALDGLIRTAHASARFLDTAGSVIAVSSCLTEKDVAVDGGLSIAMRGV